MCTETDRNAISPTIEVQQLKQIKSKYYAINLEQHRINNRNRLFEVIKKPDFAMIVPRIDANKFILVKVYRPGIRDYSLEFPAGIIDPGETPEQTAKRELKEECGFIPLTLNKLGTYYVDGYSTQKAYFFAATNLKKVTNGASLDEVEEVIVLTNDEIDAQIENQKVMHTITIACWNLYKRRFK